MWKIPILRPKLPRWDRSPDISRRSIRHGSIPMSVGSPLRRRSVLRSNFGVRKEMIGMTPIKPESILAKPPFCPRNRDHLSSCSRNVWNEARSEFACVAARSVPPPSYSRSATGSANRHDAIELLDAETDMRNQVNCGFLAIAANTI